MQMKVFTFEALKSKVLDETPVILLSPEHPVLNHKIKEIFWQLHQRRGYYLDDIYYHNSLQQKTILFSNQEKNHIQARAISHIKTETCDKCQNEKKIPHISNQTIFVLCNYVCISLDFICDKNYSFRAHRKAFCLLRF